MPAMRLENIHDVRQVLGVSQSKAARLLGVSTKAVQSYEQGCRSVPAHVRRTVAILLYMQWRKQNGTPLPCWEINRCRPDARCECPTFLFQAGDFCWMLSGTLCRPGARAASASTSEAAPDSGTPPPVVKLRSSAPATASSPPSSPPPSSSPGSQGSTPPGYNMYTNPRYGFAVLRPSSFKAEPPPADGDGLAWTTLDGQVMLAVYGANNVLNYSPAQDEADDARLLSVVYSNISGNIVTVSGYKDNGRTIVYQRDVVGPGSIDTLYWSYPVNQKTQWNTAVTLTALTFQPGNVTTAH